MMTISAATATTTRHVRAAAALSLCSIEGLNVRSWGIDIAPDVPDAMKGGELRQNRQRSHAPDRSGDEKRDGQNQEALEALGYVTHTHFDDRVTRWHRADAQRHGHLVCRTCGAEQSLPIVLLEPLAPRLHADHCFLAYQAPSASDGLCTT